MIRNHTRYERILSWLIWRLDARLERVSLAEWAKFEDAYYARNHTGKVVVADVVENTVQMPTAGTMTSSAGKWCFGCRRWNECTCKKYCRSCETLCAADKCLDGACDTCRPVAC